MINMTVRVQFLDGNIRVVPAKNIQYVGEEGARSATALYDGKEYPIYKRVEWKFWWEQQPTPQEYHSGECLICERFVTMLSSTGICEGCVMQAMIDAEESW